MTKRTYIYLLLDAEEVPRYVGKSVNCKQRFSTHRTHQGHTWAVNMVVLEIVPPWKSWKERETYWITYYLPTLYNLRKRGGAGAVPGCKRTPEAIEAHRKAITGSRQTQESNDRRSAALNGRAKSPATISALSARTKLQWTNPDSRSTILQGIRNRR